MKKVLLYLTWVLPLLTFFLFTACDDYDDEPERISFQMTSNTWYRFSPAVPAPITVNGTAFTSFAHVPGGGTGTATEMGAITTYFNQLAYTTNVTAPQPIPAGTTAASVSMILTLPVLGGPLPLIQASDFSALTLANSWLQLPATDASGKIINTVVYNNTGDAIFISLTSPSVVTPVSPTRLNFSGKVAVVGGRGKFENATGELDLTGYFNPTNPNDAGYNLDGWIQY